MGGRRGFWGLPSIIMVGPLAQGVNTCEVWFPVEIMDLLYCVFEMYIYLHVELTHTN